MSLITGDKYGQDDTCHFTLGDLYGQDDKCHFTFLETTIGITRFTLFGKFG